MALKATIHKAVLQVADMDRQMYGDYELTLARHPSETDERMLVRLLVFALNVPASGDDCVLSLAKDMWEPDEPAVWQKDLTGQILHWIEVGQPDDRRIMQASSRSDKVSLYSFSSSTTQWWSSLQSKISRARNLSVWRIPSSQSEALTGLAMRTMKLDITVQDGAIWMGNGKLSVEINLQRLSSVPHP